MLSILLIRHLIHQKCTYNSFIESIEYRSVIFLFGLTSVSVLYQTLMWTFKKMTYIKQTVRESSLQPLWGNSCSNYTIEALKWQLFSLCSGSRAVAD